MPALGGGHGSAETMGSKTSDLWQSALGQKVSTVWLPLPSF